MGVEVAGYNSITTLAAVAIPNGTSCSGPFGAKTYNSGTGYSGAATYTPATCNIYPTPTAVNTTTGTAAILTTPTNASGQSAKTLFNFALISPDPDTTAGNTSYTDRITVTFAAPTSTPASIVCTYTCANPGTCASANKTIIDAKATCTP